jgi:glycosyltransferase involved in cell wall biosynthesis
MKNVLYVSYDSIWEPISQSQIIPLLSNYSKKYKVYLISFEKDKKIKSFDIIKKNITHIKFKYQKNLLVKTVYFLFYQILLIGIIFKYKINTIHVRSYIPAFLVLLTRFFKKLNIIFDIRGFWFDEKYEAKKINIILYKILKVIEIILFKNSDKIITLSKISKKIIARKFGIERNKINIIPTFTNFEKFQNNKKLTKKKKLIFGYIGNTGMNYEFEKVVNFLEKFNKINSQWKLVVANNQLKKIPLIQSMPFKKKVELKKIDFTEMNKFYSTIDVCIYFLKSNFSKKASCPTKLGELIATNTPFITNSGIGDINKIFLKLKINEFLIDEINISKLIKINLTILKIKNNNLKYNSRSKFKSFFCENLNLNKYMNIVESFKL